MSNRRRSKRVKEEKKMGAPAGTADYLEKVQYYKALCAEVGYPWDKATELFEEASKKWSNLPLPVIVDKLAEEVREAHVKWPGKLLEFRGTLLLPEEDK